MTPSETPMNGPSRATLRQIEALFHDGTAAGLSDGQLLDRFARRRDEPAFAAIVHRHGPLVLGVCRRVLAHRHDAEDAFQATFLVLARKAGCVRVGDSLAPWLYGVAYRVAVRARGRSARARAVEREASAMKATAGPGKAVGADLLAALDEELSRLPERYRAPVVLCDLGGLGRALAARQLRIPEGTLSSRLARGRTLLRERLTRRGLAPSAGALAIALEHGATAAVPESLAELTVCAATRFAAGPLAAGAVSASVASLTEGVLKTMLLTKLKVTAVAISMAVGLVTIAWAQQNPGGGFGQSQGEGAGVGYGSGATSNRLREVERKLDRVLEALGATNAEPSNRAVMKSDTWYEIRTDKANPRSPGEGPANAFGKAGAEKGAPEAQARFAPAWVAQTKKGAGFGGGMSSDIPDRVSRLEQSLAELVDRVNRLERQASSLPNLPHLDDRPTPKR
jgi:RNA polymerase sigma factor (sigma-70 family)